MKRITIKLMFSTIEGTVVNETAQQWILKDTVEKGIKEVRSFDKLYGVPKAMALSYEIH